MNTALDRSRDAGPPVVRDVLDALDVGHRQSVFALGHLAALAPRLARHAPMVSDWPVLTRPRLDGKPG